ncbi:MAG TPA: asparagine synthase (glutamine-hydrolyzing) [Candidatus Dormibacteraeota bacterium]|nr:asparagine synthase (glutamine-hydrolyzing) [Candidatus Dormibacteraeota bacterium]
MCGICGFIDLRHTVAHPLEVVKTMAATLEHRGPDASGAWIDSRLPVALGFRRLAIIDLSDRGSQPMSSAGGRFMLVFNGEIYNHQELRADLERAGVRFRGDSDTEVLLEAISSWEISSALARANGMFAFALWDVDHRELHLVRDRLGEKPLYVFADSHRLVFGSELKALHKFPGFNPSIDRDAVSALMRYGVIPAPGSIYNNVRKLRPGTHLVVSCEDDGLKLCESVFWALEERGPTEASEIVHQPADIDELESLLLDAVRLRLSADVPVGALLSGGVDSSLVVALMQAASPRPVRTFTIGFAESSYDESRVAAQVARHLGTDHHELRVSARDALDTVPLLPDIYDEPFADSSQIPTVLVSRLAREHVKVALTGDGGDELFAGYNRYLWTARLMPSLRQIPFPIRRHVAGALAHVPDVAWRRVETATTAVMGRPGTAALPDKARKMQALLLADGTADAHERLMSRWPDPLPTTDFRARAHDTQRRVAGDPLRSMMLADIRQYLPDDILVKVDRASMAVGLEARVPLLDHRVVEYAWAQSPATHMQKRGGKRLLRAVLARYLPPSITDRPKAGFAVDLGGWLRGDLRQWAEDLLDPEQLRSDGYLDPRTIRETWARHLTGRADLHDRLWPVLVFQQWLHRRSVGSAVSSGG